MAKLDIASGYGPEDWGFESLQARQKFRDVPVMEKPHDYYMDEALKEARRAYEAGEVPVGCVIVHKGMIVARAHNQVEMLRDATAHAEMIAITQAGEAVGDWRLKGAVLYVTKEPCPMCAGAIVLSRLGGVIFGAGDPKAGAVVTVNDIREIEKQLNSDGRLDVVTGVRENECSSLLRDFFIGKRKNKSGEVAESG